MPDGAVKRSAREGGRKIAWARSSLGATLSPMPTADLIAILAGLPLAAAIGGWLLGGRQPTAIARQPLE